MRVYARVQTSIYKNGDMASEASGAHLSPMGVPGLPGDPGAPSSHHFSVTHAFFCHSASPSCPNGVLLEDFGSKCVFWEVILAPFLEKRETVKTVLPPEWEPS